MKTLATLAIALGMLCAPALSFAQATNAPLTRAEVRADLIRVEQAGFNPASGDDVYYPADIQAAEAKVAAQRDAQTANDAAGGVPSAGTSAAGHRTHARNTSPATCVGPESYCDIYFGS
jgi:uncharacterized protein DUF4148